MTFRFLHAADVHLGNRQYGRPERQSDFARAFRDLTLTAIDRSVDAVLIAGDMFHKRNVDARTFVQSVVLLQRLQEHGITVLAIEGNHERPFFSEGQSWLEALDNLGLLRLLSGYYQEGELKLPPYSQEYHRGAFVELKGVRIYGQSYVGTTTPLVVHDLAQRLAMDYASDATPAPYTILMLHTGLGGVLEHYSTNVFRETLEVLRPYVNYLALGHIHKPFSQDDWLYNPGSLENNSANEVEWDERGYYIVEVEPGDPPRHRATLHRSLRRPYLRLRFSVEPYADPDALYAALTHELKRLSRDGKPVLELRLYGVLNFRRQDLDMTHIQQMAEAIVDPLLCQIQDMIRSNVFDIRVDDEMSRADMERLVLSDLAGNDLRRRPHAQQWSEAALRIKQLALDQSTPESIIAVLEQLLTETASLSDEGEDA
ncbi:MAG: metallophosphoesterase family protein [Anaerolineae bacterium]|jgi:exonuclease SbcD|nr:DNA repair exonuclease [Chloroflexota bacterium]